ncbi:MAG TPA: dihydrofolate reductase [Legionella sp.]|nr:dihydrofolate reductase [Legionella sp.]
MSIISIIAAIDEAGGMGLKNQLLCHLPADLQYFKKNTMGKPIIMGRNTYESIGKPLPGRSNIIVSRTIKSIPDVKVVDSIETALDEAKAVPESMIIGGAQIYHQAIEYVTRLYITRIHHLFKADVFFPHIDKTVWTCRNEEFRHRDDKNIYDMTFFIYERK